MRRAAVSLALALGFAVIAFADGVAYKRGSLLEGWSLLGEKAQTALIHFHKGREALLLAIDLEERPQIGSAVWIFPIPSGPQEAQIDILREEHFFSGYDIEAEFRRSLGATTIGLGSFSTFPLSLPIIAFRQMGGIKMGPIEGDAAAAHGGGYSGPGVTVHRIINKMGLTTELVTTKDGEALVRYLSGKGLDLPDASLAILDWYVGREYSFVVSYADQVTDARLSVLVSFPTDKMYFPLKPTGVYGAQAIPVSLLVVGHVSPKLPWRIRAGSSIRYFNGELSSVYLGSQGPFWLGRRSDEISDFTEITIYTRSRNFEDDLWMRNSPPLSIRLLSRLERLPGLFKAAFVVMIYVAFSLLASWAAGRVSFKQDPPPRRKLILNGLLNCLTLWTFVPMTLYIYKPRRMLKYILSFYLFFLGLLGAGTGLLWMLYS